MRLLPLCQDVYKRQGQNLGAGKYERIYDGMKKAFFISLVLTGFAAVVCVFFGRAIVGLFLTAPTEEVLSYATVYLRTISVFFFFLSILYLYRTSLQGLGKGMVPMIGGILELVGRLAVIMLFAKDYGLSLIHICHSSIPEESHKPVLLSLR